MKVTRFVLTAVVWIAVCVPAVYAQEGYDHDHAAEAVAAPVEEAAGLVQVGNKICPLSGHPVGSMGEGVEVEYEGKVYRLCCEMCIDAFKAEPQKYIQMIEEQAAAESQE